MLAWRLSDIPPAPCPQGVVEGSEADAEIRDPNERAKVKTTIFLGCTSNLISAGTRETVSGGEGAGLGGSARAGGGEAPRGCHTARLQSPEGTRARRPPPLQIRYLVEHRLVSCLVTTAGGIEEDLMKCLAPHYIGSTAGVEGFNLKGAELRKRGMNRIGNLLVRDGCKNGVGESEGWGKEGEGRTQGRVVERPMPRRLHALHARVREEAPSPTSHTPTCDCPLFAPPSRSLMRTTVYPNAPFLYVSFSPLPCHPPPAPLPFRSRIRTTVYLRTG
jgi:hypothetical protein